VLRRDEARVWHTRCRDLYREGGAGATAAFASVSLASIDLAEGRVDVAIAALERSVDTLRTVARPVALGLALSMLALALWRARQHVRAEAATLDARRSPSGGRHR
jgi:hypothetical protein